MHVPDGSPRLGLDLEETRDGRDIDSIDLEADLFATDQLGPCATPPRTR
jgi:hypothetical protein